MRRTPQETEISKQHILRAAERAFSRHGYAGANMDKIAKTAGMTKGAIFWHYGSKLGLFKAVLEKAIRRVRELMENAFATNQGILEQCQTIMLEIRRDLAFAVLLQLGNAESQRGVPKSALNALDRQVAAIFHDMHIRMEAARKRGELKDDADTLEILMTLIMFMSAFTQIEKVKSIVMVERPLDGEAAIRAIFRGLNSFKK